MPNRLKITQQTGNSQEFYISRRSQTVGLNYMNVSDYEAPTGIYHCEIADENNVTSYLYVGIYPPNQGLAHY